MPDTQLYFASDYQEGMHPKILARLAETNLQKEAGYGFDSFSLHAKEQIRETCQTPKAEVYFLAGGTQTNAVVIGALLRPYEGVLAAKSAHIAVHEAGAIERTGHEVLEIPSTWGKISAADVQSYVETFHADANHEHMVFPGMVYLSQPTEFGTLYSLAELQAMHDVCQTQGLKLYIDGARLAYALAATENDVTLPDLARLADVFYIGGTKCGAILGEAVVLPNPSLLPHFFTYIKRDGALLAKGRLLGIQFEMLFTDGLYNSIGKTAIQYAHEIKDALQKAQIPLHFDSPTNQVFFRLDNVRAEMLAKQVVYSFWEKYDATHSVLRLATSWATQADDVQALVKIIKHLA